MFSKRVLFRFCTFLRGLIFRRYIPAFLFFLSALWVPSSSRVCLAWKKQISIFWKGASVARRRRATLCRISEFVIMPKANLRRRRTRWYTNKNKKKKQSYTGEKNPPFKGDLGGALFFPLPELHQRLRWSVESGRPTPNGGARNGTIIRIKRCQNWHLLNIKNIVKPKNSLYKFLISLSFRKL